MKKLLLGFGLSMLFSIAAAPFMPATASAQLPQGASAIETTCEETSGWYVNGDETSRKPEVTAAGFKFEATDLMHREVNLPLAQLTNPGSYLASPAPDQPSFFSVEVRDASTNAYGTLRWNKNAAMWQITIGPANPPNPAVTDGTFSGADPVALLVGKVTKWGAFTAATKVISFGVGYTNSPPGTVATMVSQVSFNEKSYSLVCAPPTPSASASSPAPSSSASGSAAPIAGGTGSLPVTGARPWVIAGIALAIIAVGLLLIWLARRNRVRFTFNLLDD